VTEIDVLKRARELLYQFPHPESLYYRTPAGAIVDGTYRQKKRADIVSLLRCVTTDQKLIGECVTRLHSVIGKASLLTWTSPDIARALESAATVAGAA
jgi:hypothetical protein